MRSNRAGRPVNVVGMTPLLEGEAAACRGGADDPIKQLLDWITGTPPKPGQWPPQML